MFPAEWSEKKTVKKRTRAESSVSVSVCVCVSCVIRLLTGQVIFHSETPASHNSLGMLLHRRVEKQEHSRMIGPWHLAT